MAFIQIISLKGGPASCANYYFKEGACIEPGEVAFVPDDELSTHIDTELVFAVDGRTVKNKIVNPDDMKAAKAE